MPSEYHDGGYRLQDQITEKSKNSDNIVSLRFAAGAEVPLPQYTTPSSDMELALGKLGAAIPNMG